MERRGERNGVLVKTAKKSPRALRGDSKRHFADGYCCFDFIFCGLKEKGLDESSERNSKSKPGAQFLPPSSAMIPQPHTAVFGDFKVTF